MHIGFIYFPYVCNSRAKLSLSTAFKLFFLVNRDANHPYHRLQFIFLIYIFLKGKPSHCGSWIWIQKDMKKDTEHKYHMTFFLYL
jgi:hypothetical protein